MLLWTFSGAFAASASDISGHWAEDQLNDWLDQGLLSGYEDGTVRPNQTVTRAEFVAMVNRAFGFASGADIYLQVLLYEHAPTRNDYGVLVTNIDDDPSDHVITFTITFSDEGLKDPETNNRFADMAHGSEVHFDLFLLGYKQSSHTVTLPAAGTP